MTISLLLTSSVWAGVVKKNKSEINFAKFGTFKTEETVKISDMKKAVDAESDFKGKGLVGKLAGKFALSSGDTSRIIDLASMSIYEINHKKKEYKVLPIEKISYESGEGNQAQTGESEKRPDEGNDICERDIIAALVTEGVLDPAKAEAALQGMPDYKAQNGLTGHDIE